MLSLRLCPTEVKEVKLAAPQFPFATPDQTTQGFAVIWVPCLQETGIMGSGFSIQHLGCSSPSAEILLPKQLFLASDSGKQSYWLQPFPACQHFPLALVIDQSSHAFSLHTLSRRWWRRESVSQEVWPYLSLMKDALLWGTGLQQPRAGPV